MSENKIDNNNNNNKQDIITQNNTINESNKEYNINLSNNNENNINKVEKQENIENKAIKFISFNESTKKFVISPEAKKILSSPQNTKIGIIALVGKYRTGKSFLLNKVLLKGQKVDRGFEVGPTIKPCTKGIWLYSSPIVVKNEENETFNTYLIDTEGLGAYDEEINHDSKIFLISILLSSLFLYNSFGTIDEQALNNISLILTLSETLKLREKSNYSVNFRINSQKNTNNSLNNNNTNNEINKNNDFSEEKEIAKYFPSLLWILRDFALKLEDSKGNSINAKQYLENALSEQNGDSDSIRDKNLVRKMIKLYFPSRDCFPLVRPVETESALQSLNSLDDSDMRPEFLEQSRMLREKIFTKIRPKTLKNKVPVSGEMLMNFLETIVSAVNRGAVPVIESSWEYIVEGECLRGVKKATEEYREKIGKFEMEKMGEEGYFNELEIFNNELTEKLTQKFINENSQKFDDVLPYVAKLKSMFKSEFKKLNEENSSMIKEKYIQILDKKIAALFGDIEKLKQKTHINFISELLQIKDKVDSLTNDFPTKHQISYDKILSATKKFIEEIYVKSKNEFQQEIKTLKNTNEIVNEKLKNLQNEYNKDKVEFKQTVDKYNDMLIEYKLKIKSNEEKIKNFENEKKMIKEANARNIINNSKEFEVQIQNLNMEINKLKNDIKTKDEDFLVFKLNTEKVGALTSQKTSFLEKELEQWKSRFTQQNKELSSVKSQVISLQTECEKLREENKNLKILNSREKEKNNRFQGVNLMTHSLVINNSSKFSGGICPEENEGNINSNVSSKKINCNNKILLELIQGQGEIKEILDRIEAKISKKESREESNYNINNNNIIDNNDINNTINNIENINNTNTNNIIDNNNIESNNSNFINNVSNIKDKS